MSYDYFTKKQAGILYGAVKRGQLKMDKKDINRMYNRIVNTRDMNLSMDDKIFRGHLERAISHFLDNRLEFAQAELDGHIVKSKRVLVDTFEREATEDDWFYDPGEIIVEEVYETQWVIDD